MNRVPLAVPPWPRAQRLLTSLDYGRRARQMEAAIRRFWPPQLSPAWALLDGRYPRQTVDLRPKAAPIALRPARLLVLGHPLPKGACRVCGGPAENWERQETILHRCTICPEEWETAKKATVLRAREETP